MALTRNSIRRGNIRKLVGLDPVSLDPRLQQLLLQVSDCSSYDEFAKWTMSVLGRYEAFVEQDGVEVARQDDTQLLAKLKVLREKLQTLEEQSTAPSALRVTATKALNEIQDDVQGLINSVADYAPTTEEAEKEVGYTRYQLGAALLRNGFQTYLWMVKNLLSLEQILDPRGGVVERSLAQSPQAPLLRQLLWQIRNLGNTLDEMTLLPACRQVCQLAGYPVTDRQVQTTAPPPIRPTKSVETTPTSPKSTTNSPVSSPVTVPSLTPTFLPRPSVRTMWQSPTSPMFVSPTTPKPRLAFSTSTPKTATMTPTSHKPSLVASLSPPLTKEDEIVDLQASFAKQCLSPVANADSPGSSSRRSVLLDTSWIVSRNLVTET